MQFYQHHIGDFKKDTWHLTHEERSIYLELLWMYYDQETPLENDSEQLARLVRSDVITVDRLLKDFFTLKENHWHHMRVDEEVKAFYDRSEQARIKANKRWSMQQQCNSNATGMLPNTHNPNTQDNIYTDEFQKFWVEYPNKVKKEYAFKIWTKQKLDGQLDVVLKHLKFYKDWKKKNNIFMEHPSTYLSQKVYLDPVEVSRERKAI